VFTCRVAAHPDESNLNKFAGCKNRMAGTAVDKNRIAGKYGLQTIAACCLLIGNKFQPWKDSKEKRRW
jgi:hypothetical protein